MVLSAQGLIVATDDGRILVSGKEYKGEFGDGDQGQGLEDEYGALTEVDNSFLDSGTKVIDVISGY